MLQAIREKATGILGIALVVLISITFALWGIQNYFTTTVSDAIAVVNGQEISVKDFQDRFNRYRSRMQSQFGNMLDRDYFDQPLVRRQFLDSLIEDEVLRQAAVESGMEVTGERLAEQINGIDAFKVGDQFSSDRYLSLLAQQGTTPQRFESDLREGILVGEFEAVIGATSVPLAGELANLRRLQDQQRSFRYAAFKAADFVEPVTVGEDEILQYYESHEQDFTEPEKVVIDYLELSPGDLDIKVDVSEATLLQRYEDQKARFMVPERRLTSHILIEVPENADAQSLRLADEKARALAERARAGEAFENLAREFSDDPGSASEGGDLRWVERGVMVSAFEDALFAMQPGEVSDPVKTVYGFHVIKLRELDAARGKSFEEARDELAQEFRDTEAERLFLEMQDRLYDLTYEDQGSLASAAAALELEVQTAGPFSRTGGQGIASDPRVVEAAFSDLVMEAGSNSDPLTLDGNRVVVLRLHERIDPVLRPLADVSEEIRALLIKERSQELAREAAQELLEKLREQGDLDALAESRGLEVQTAAAVGRNGAGIDAGLVQGVFRMPRPQGDIPVTQMLPFAGDHFAVVELSAVIDRPTTASDDDRNEALEASLARGYSAAETAALKKSLRARAKIKVMEDRLATNS